MALTEQRLRTRPATAELKDERLSRRASVSLMVAWAVLLPLALVLEPAPAEVTYPWWAFVVSNALLAAIAATFVGLVRRRPWAPTASFVASSIFVTGVFACPASGHHAFGLWWFGEFAAALTLVGLSAGAYLKARR
ncbi:MAG: hypothetical protein ACRDKJ_11340 [Actinomycetota bacterium]